MTDDQARGIIGMAEELGSKLVASLPAQFLALVLMTLVFNLAMLFFLDRQSEMRERVLGPVLQACIAEHRQ